MSNEGKIMSWKIPQWMKMSEENSNGGALISTLGEQLDLLKDFMINILQEPMVNVTSAPEFREVDIFNIDFLYKFNVPRTIDVESPSFNMSGIINTSKYDLTEAKYLYDFYRSDDSSVFIDHEKWIIYSKIKFDTLILNGIEFNGEAFENHHVWNPLDEMGLMFGCHRYPNEKNADYKIRLFEVFRKPGNSSKTGLINFISRSLKISEEEIHINELSDDEFVSSLINEDGTLQTDLKEYIEISRKINDLDSTLYWNLLEEDNLGLKYLPMIWDTGLDKWDDKDIQSGIGWNDDLEVDFEENVKIDQDFEYGIWAEGLQNPDRKIYPEHEFKYKIYAEGYIQDKGYKPEEYQYLIKASRLIRLVFEVVATKIYDNRYTLLFPSSNQAINVSQDATNIEAEKYIVDTDHVLFTNGNYCVNENKRYLQLLSILQTNNDKQTPKLSDITVSYKLQSTPTVTNKITVKGESGIESNYLGDPNHVRVGFEVNNWGDATPVVRVRQDVNDIQRAIIKDYDDDGNLIPDVNRTIQLDTAEYRLIYDSGGDWEDGMMNSGTKNVKITNNGTLTLKL